MPRYDDDPHPPPKKARWPLVVGIVGGIVGVLVLVSWYALQTTLLPRVEQAQHLTMSTNNIRQIAVILAGQAPRRGWPKLTGKAFVLSVVASGVVDADHPANVQIFFSPADEERGADRVDPGRWQELTMEALLAGEDFDDLTSYAGPAQVSTAAVTGKGPVPILADLSFEDVVIVAFTDGSVRPMTRKDLGLARGDPIVIGPESKSEVLRALSYE